MTDRTKRAASAAALLLILILTVWCARRGEVRLLRTTPLVTPDAGALYEVLAPSSATLTIGNVRGAASIIGQDSDYVYLLTAAHLAVRLTSEGAAGQITYATGKSAPVEAYLVSEDADCAVLRSEKSALSTEDAAALKIVYTDRDAYARLSVGDAMALFAVEDNTALSRRGSVLVGSVADTLAPVEGGANPMLYGYLAATAGMSGSAVYDAYGALIGVLSAGGADGSVLCVPYPVLTQELPGFF